MKRIKTYIYTAFAAIFLTACIMNFAMLLFSRMLFAVNFSVTLIIGIAIFFLLRNYIDYLICVSKSVRMFMDEDNLKVLELVPLPMVLTDIHGEVLLYNKTFKEVFLDDENILNINISELFAPDSNLEAPFRKKIEFKGRKFLVNAERMNDILAFYFFDNTDYLDLKKQYTDSRICVALAMFDNKEELFQSVSEEESIVFLVSVEAILASWMGESEGILKKLSDGKYLLLFEEKYLKHFISQKFEIINQIHEIKVDSHRFATLSCGVSYPAKTIVKTKILAENALNMALGRGGDQVAVKSEKGYEFFGGTSPGLEKRSKVRTRVVSTALREKIKSSDIVFIMGHKFSDFDSVGSSIGLRNICSGVEKKPTYLILDKEKSMAKPLIEIIEKFVSPQYIITPEEAISKITDKSFLIVVDTHSEKFLENYNLYHMFKNTAIIDHHRMTVDKIKNTDIFFHEPFASSVCEMVTEIIEYVPNNCLKKWEAECLLAGIILDTKNFSLRCGVRTFEAAAYLKRKGADSAIVKKMFADSMEMYKIKCKIIESTYILKGCAIAKYKEGSPCHHISCVRAADELLGIKDVKASFVIFESSEGIDISARSLGEVNVQLIMESLGGGGHQTMAAVHISGISLEEAELKLKNLIEIKV